MKPAVSLADIARKLGCSPSTVSLALRGDQRISRPVREKIHRVAKRLAYRPNPVLAAVATHRFKKAAPRIPLAFLTQGESYVQSEESMFAWMQGVASDLGYDLQRYTATDLRAVHDPSRMLYHRGVEGIILSYFFETEVLSLDWKLFSIVALGGERAAESSTTAFNRASADVSLTVRRAWLEAAKVGYERIGLVLFEHKVPISDDILRYSAGLYCLSQTPRRRQVPPLRICLADSANPHEPLARWFTKFRPDVVIGSNEYVRWLLFELGYKSPEDIAFIALERDNLLPTGAAGLEDCQNSILKGTVELLDQQIRHRLRGVPDRPQIMNIRPQWAPGATLPPASPRSTRHRPSLPCGNGVPG